MKKLFTIAATSDFHLEKYTIAENYFSNIDKVADLLLIGGDMNNGKKEEVEYFLKFISKVKIPILIILGNHDCHSRKPVEIKRQLLAGNKLIKILDGNYQKFNFQGKTVVVSGVKGYGGGFSPYNIMNKGEGSTKKFCQEEMREVNKLKKVFEKINKIKFDFQIILSHWSPFVETIKGEPKELYIVLGSSRMGDVIELQKPNLVLNGHAHKGPRGIKKARKMVPACNIALDVNGGKMCLFDFFESGKIKLR